MSDIQRSRSFRNSLKSFRHSHSGSISSISSTTNEKAARTSVSTSIISAPVLNSDITPVIYRRDSPKESNRRSQVIVEEEECFPQNQAYQPQHQTPYYPQHQSRMSNSSRIPPLQGHNQRVISSRASTPSMRPSPNVSPQLAQPIAFPMTRKASTSKLQPAMSTTRSSLLHAPPMRDVWLDDDGDDSSSVAMSSDDSDCEDSKQANAIRKLKQKRKLLRRFGSKSERKGPTHHQSTMSISEPISSQPIVELKHTPSRSSMIAPQRSTSYAGNTHTRSSSATSRIMSFIGSNRSDKDSKQPLKSKISAPTNFVHHKHVDVDYLRGSSSDNRALRAATLQGIVGTSSSASSANTKSRPTSCLSSSSSSISIPQAVSSRQPNSTPKMGGHRHEDSIASVATTTNASTISHAASTPMTSAAPSPSNLSLRCASPTNLTPPPIVGAIDRKPSVESFGSWNATPNSEFFEQQNWLLSSTPDDALEHRYSHANPYSCYYHQSPKLATAITTNKTNNGTISRRPENYQPQRSSMLLPSPKLPVTTMAVPSVTQSSPRTNEGLGIGPLPENSSKILYEEKQDEDGFQWF